MKRVRAASGWREPWVRRRRPGQLEAPTPQRLPDAPLHLADVADSAERYDEVTSLCGARVEVVDDDLDRGTGWCALCRDASRS